MPTDEQNRSMGLERTAYQNGEKGSVKLASQKYHRKTKFKELIRKRKPYISKGVIENTNNTE